MSKGNSVRLRTFNEWGVDSVIGYKLDIENEGMVNFIWCKVCAAQKEGLKNNPNIRGQVLTSAKAFIDGTNSVTKYQVSKHVLFICFIVFSYIFPYA